MSKLYFIVGTQSLYGDDVLQKVFNDGKKVSQFLDEALATFANVEFQGFVRSNEEIEAVCMKATADPECSGVITWMHTFSPAKMWIKGLQKLHKPICHLHTQFNEHLPYESIDMDFMNLNQSAHGDREFGFILKRLNIPHQIVVGYYQKQHVIDELKQFARVANAMNYSSKLKVAMFGNNMREVAVTDGDRVESQIKYGWEVNYHATGDLVTLINEVTEKELEERYEEIKAAYKIKTTDLDAVKEQIKYEIALEKFVKDGEYGAFTDTFQDLHGMKQLPGMAAQRMMNKGYGFAPEGDYKTSALSAVMQKMAEHMPGATGFLEDYTYDLVEGDETVLAAHMLEISPAFAATKPTVEVHPLGIGGKNPPARLVFDGITGSGISVCMIDLGDRFRIICADIELIKQIAPMPNLPVARVMWKVKPNFEEGVKAWLNAGGGHHVVVSTSLQREDIELFAKLTNTEIVSIY
ncbi:MAG: L-arabinose isomerase [Acholeplasmataceae bacterium]